MGRQLEPTAGRYRAFPWPGTGGEVLNEPIVAESASLGATQKLTQDGVICLLRGGSGRFTQRMRVVVSDAVCGLLGDGQLPSCGGPDIPDRLSAPPHGGKALHHTAATNLLRHGAFLREVAGVLRQSDGAAPFTASPP